MFVTEDAARAAPNDSFAGTLPDPKSGETSESETDAVDDDRGEHAAVG
jgi:hypothetical protein